MTLDDCVKYRHRAARNLALKFLASLLIIYVIMLGVRHVGAMRQCDRMGYATHTSLSLESTCVKLTK